MKKKLFLLDAMALIYRAYYAMIKSPRITSKGFNTSAILGFTNTLYDVLKSEKPTHIAISFDTGAPTLRHADFEDYKVNREETPNDILLSIPYIKKIIEAFNIPILSLDGYEADDVIGTIAKQAEIENFDVFMMTSDKDYGQLVSDRIFVYKPSRFGKKPEVVGKKEICNQYGIEKPEQLIDILGLWGDASDNIPGVPMIGEVRAKKLIADFGSIENIYENIEKVENQKIKTSLIEHKEQALLSKMLATIILDVPIEYSFSTMEFQGPSMPNLMAVFDELEFKSLSQRITRDWQGKKDNQEEIDFFTPLVPEIKKEKEKIESLVKIPNNFHTIPSLEEFCKLDIATKEPLFFDWIVWNDKVAGFSFSNNDVIYNHFLETEEKSFIPILCTFFDKKQTIVTTNSKSFYKFFSALQITSHVQLFDIQIAHYLIQPEHNHSLAALSRNFLNHTLTEIGKEELKKQPSKEKLAKISGERIVIYQLLYPILLKKLEESNTIKLFDTIEMPLVEILADMEYNGITLDTVALNENSKELSNDIKNLEKDIFDLAGMEFNVASPKQLGEVLFEHLQIIKNARLTKTKQYQTGEEILIKLVNKHPIVPLVLEYRSLSKLKNTYIDSLPQLINPTTRRVHTTFNQIVTSTGRLSSLNPNLQNIPIRTKRGKEIRKAFVAKNDDFYILSADYSQIELRIVASVSDDLEMIEAFRQQLDIHAVTASRVYGVAIEEVTDEMRRNAKTVNFGILYGISAFGLSERLHISRPEAANLIDEYFKKFPKVGDYLKNTIALAKHNGFVETLLGRRRYITDIDSPNAVLRKAAERNAINAPIQGTAADLIKIAMISIFKELNQRKMKSKLLLQVHDELIFEVHKEEVEKIKDIIENKMTQALQLKVPLVVDINYGKNWFEAH